MAIYFLTKHLLTIGFEFEKLIIHSKQIKITEHFLTLNLWRVMFFARFVHERDLSVVIYNKLVSFLILFTGCGGETPAEKPPSGFMKD